MEKILSVLKELRVAEFRLVEKTVHGKEWFFIQKKLDMSRAKETKNYYLTIYQTIYNQQERFKGQASAKISPKEDNESLREIITQLIEEARYVKNPYFELPSPQESEVQVSGLGDIQEIIRMMNDFYETETLSLNSYELFEAMSEVRIVNSKGIDVSYFYPSYELEVIINAKDADHEIEIYQDYHFGQPNITDLKHRIGEACHQAEDRKNAIEMTNNEICSRVILSKENVLRIMQYYLSQLNCEFQYRGYNALKVESRFGPDDFHLEGLAYLENSSRNYPYDDDGRHVKSVVLVNDGEIKQFWGRHEVASYCQVEDTTMVYNYKVGSGKMSIQDMKAQPYLELVQFSDFSCNPITGEFAGEIRLGYYFDGENTTPITTGSISGNIKANEPTMILSKELVQYDYAVVPQAILLNQVTISVE